MYQHIQVPSGGQKITVNPDFTLIDYALLVRMNILHRIFDGNDVPTLEAVAMINQGRE